MQQQSGLEFVKLNIFIIVGEINIKLHVNCITIKSFMMPSWWNGKNWNSQPYLPVLFASLDRANSAALTVCLILGSGSDTLPRIGAILRCLISVVVNGYGFSSVSFLFTNLISCNYMLLVALLTMLMSQIHWTCSCQINF